MGEPVRLEPLSERHLDGIVTLVADPDVLRFTRVPEPPPPGLALEGVLRSVHLKQDRRSDNVLWSRLPSDPEPR